MSGDNRSELSSGGQGQAAAGAGSNELPRLFSALQAGTLDADGQARLAELLAPGGRNSGSMVAATMTREVFSGPVPPAYLLNEYDVETRQAIVEMAREEQRHAHEQHRRALEGAIQKDRRGQWIGGGIAIAGLAAASWIAPHSATAAAVIGALDLFGMVALFVAPRVFDRRLARDEDTEG